MSESIDLDGISTNQLPFDYLEDFEQSESSSNNWEYISCIANNVNSLIRLLTGGVFCLDKETKLPGYLLLGASIADLANKILPDLGVYNEIASWMTSSSQMQETIASRLETGIECAFLVAGTAGATLGVLRNWVHERPYASVVACIAGATVGVLHNWLREQLMVQT